MQIPYTVQPREDTGLYNAKVGIWLFLASEVMLFGAFFSAYVLLRVQAPEWPHGLLNIPIGTFNTAVLIASSVTVVLAWASLKMHNFGRFRVFQGLTVLCALTFLVVKTFEYREKFIHYEVWKTDGTHFSGHIDGSPMFWTHKTLDAKGLTEVKFTKDPPITLRGLGAKAAAAAHGEGHAEAAAAAPAAEAAHGAAAHHETVTIPRSEIKRLSAYVPAHSTYFAIYFTMTALHGLHVLGGAIVIAYIGIQGSRMWKTDPDRLTNRVEVSGLFWHFVDLVWIFLFPVLYLL